MNLSCQIFIKGFTVQKIARMKNGINRYEKVRIDLGWKPKECLQSYKEFCQSLDIFGVVHVHVCAQHRRAGVSAAVNFFGASTRLRRVSAPKKLTAASTPALLCFAHTCTYISYTKNVSWLAKFFMWLATFFKFHPRYNNVLFCFLKKLTPPNIEAWYLEGANILLKSSCIPIFTQIQPKLGKWEQPKVYI